MKRHAFTLVELLVVIAIIGLLSTIAVVSLGPARMNARNTQRKANLVQLSKALELYYNDNGSYPPTSGSWRGDCSTWGPYPDTGAGAWIPNFGAYMAQLPHDPHANQPNPSSANTSCQQQGGLSCYIYFSDGIDYKLLAYCTPEGTLSPSDPFYANGRGTYAWQVSSDGGYSKF